MFVHKLERGRKEGEAESLLEGTVRETVGGVHFGRTAWEEAGVPR